MTLEATTKLIERMTFKIESLEVDKRKLKADNARLVAAEKRLRDALENLLAMTKHFVPDPRKIDYSPDYESEEDWAEQALAGGEGGDDD
jgi:hypothetical protein